MINMNSVDQKKKAIYLVSENVQGTLFKRGIACAVSFQNETFLLTSSSVVKEVNASEKPKQLIAERFSRKYFGDYRAEVSILMTIGKFTFLKIVQECKCHKREGWSIGPFIFNVDIPSSETKASAMSPFCGRQKFKVVEFECNGNNMNIEVNTEIPIERTSIVGAPIFNEKKNTQKRKSQYPVNAVHIGVVGLNSEGRLCSYYLNKDVLDNLLSCKEKRGSVGTQTNKPVEQGFVPDSGKGQPTTSLDHPSVSGDGTNIKRAVEDAVPDSGKGQPTTSLDHPSVSGDASNIKRSVEETCMDEPAISYNRPRQFERGEPAEFGTRNFSKLPPLTQSFTGREKVVEEIVSKLTQPKPFRMVVLLSIPGAGKTQAAIKVGHDLLKYNKSLIFIEKQETLEQLCTEIIRGISGWYISGSNDLVCIAKEKLKAVGSDVCIILDNTEDIQENEREEFDSFVNFVVQEAPAIQLIITSQEDVGCTSLNVHKKFLLPLDPQSCALLLQGSVPITEEKAQEIGTLCGGMPLLLVPCVALLQKSFSPESLIQWLKEDPIQFLRDKAENVYNALGRFLRKMPNSLLKNLIKLSVFPASFSVKDISEIYFNDELEAETVKTTMVGCSLLERMADGKYALHPLVREYCRASRKNLGMDEVGKSAQDKFNEHFIEKLRTLSKEFITKGSAMGAISSFRKYRANIMEALRNYMYLDEKSSTDERAFGVDVAISTEVLDFLCKVLLPPAECLKFYRRCYDIAEGSGDQRRLANSLNALGFRYLCDVAHLKPNQPSLDKFKEAKGIYEKLSKEQQNCQAHAHILSKLGLCLCLQGEEKEEGLELIHEGIALKEKLGDPLYLAAGYCDLGNAHCTLGDHQKAIDIWEKKTLPIYRNLLGEHPWTATILHFIALSYKALAETNVDGAVENSRNSLKLRKKLLGFHQDTARSHVLLSDVLVEIQNDFKSGLKELEQALEIQKEVLGENHSSTTETEAKMMRIARMQDSN